MDNVRLITFGHHYGPAPKADRVYDVREGGESAKSYSPEEEEQEAAEIASECRPGEKVAIGCEYGQERSVQVARMVKTHLKGNATITHRDLEGEYNMSPLRGSHKDIINENMRALKHKGMSEADAASYAMHAAKESGE